MYVWSFAYPLAFNQSAFSLSDNLTPIPFIYSIDYSMFLVVVPADIGKRIVRISPVNTTPIIIKVCISSSVISRNTRLSNGITPDPTPHRNSHLYRFGILREAHQIFPMFADMGCHCRRMMHIRIIGNERVLYLTLTHELRDLGLYVKNI